MRQGNLFMSNTFLRQPSITTAVVKEAATALPQVNKNLKEHEREIRAAADERATMPSLLCRLAK